MTLALIRHAVLEAILGVHGPQCVSSGHSYCSVKRKRQLEMKVEVYLQVDIQWFQYISGGLRLC